MKKSPESGITERQAVRRLAGLVAAHERYARLLAQCQADAPAIFATLRKGLGLRQQDIAEKIGVTNVYISKIENGRLPAGYATLEALHGIADAEQAEKRRKQG